LQAGQKREEAGCGRGKFTNDPFLIAIHADVRQHGVTLVNSAYENFGNEEAFETAMTLTTISAQCVSQQVLSRLHPHSYTPLTSGEDIRGL
jgi:hypothetical protein